MSKRLVVKTPRGYAVRTKNTTAYMKWYPMQSRLNAQWKTALGILMREVLHRVEPYVPKQTGFLILSGVLGADPENGTITWDTPYAGYMNRGINWKTGKPLQYNGAPMRGAHWVDRMMADYGDAIAEKGARGSKT